LVRVERQAQDIRLFLLHDRFTSGFFGSQFRFAVKALHGGTGERTFWRETN
jgi:hypothetical protein